MMECLPKEPVGSAPKTTEAISQLISATSSFSLPQQKIQK